MTNDNLVQMKTKPAKKQINITGIVLTLLVTSGFVWAIFQLSAISNSSRPITPDEIRENEILAFRNLKIICEAQQEYIKQDRNSDGQQSYAMFYVHLWRSVTPQGKPVPLGLIPRELGFAMEETGPLKGYYYMDQRKRLKAGKTGIDFDYTKEWAVAAMPGARGGTGVLTFIVDQSQRIFASPGIHSQPHYPYEPSANGWTRIYSEDSLKAFQKKVAYPTNLK